MVNSNITKKKNRWGSLIGALIAILVGTTAFTWKTDPFTSLFNRSGKSCHCVKDVHNYSGIVEDCCCDYQTVDRVREDVLHPLLEELVKTPFFRYFKVKLWCDCPFWPEDGMCRLRDCSVCECPESEFPELFKKPSHHGLSSDDLICQEGKPQGAVDRTLDAKAFRGWMEIDNPWTYDDETDNDEMTYVNLLLNPERYTGYIGSSARRIWDAIYTENCPKYASGEICQEKKILYKLISGLHSSISIHIAADYLLNEATNTGFLRRSQVLPGLFELEKGKRNAHYTQRTRSLSLPSECRHTIAPITAYCAASCTLAAFYAFTTIYVEKWGQNHSLMYDRVLRYPERVKNLYFSFLFVLRAVTKAADYLEQADYETGNPDEDLKTQSYMKQLLYNPKVQSACPIPFDEAKLWKGQSGPELKQQVQKQFRNISAIMDCVGCEKCRLWGKLQVLGLGTALKILFTVNGESHMDQTLQLQRNEVIALVNLLHRLSESIKLVHEMGLSSESSMEGNISVQPAEGCPLHRFWASIVGPR